MAASAPAARGGNAGAAGALAGGSDRRTPRAAACERSPPATRPPCNPAAGAHAAAHRGARPHHAMRAWSGRRACTGPAPRRRGVPTAYCPGAARRTRPIARRASGMQRVAAFYYGKSGYSVLRRRKKRVGRWASGPRSKGKMANVVTDEKRGNCSMLVRRAGGDPRVGGWHDSWGRAPRCW